MRKGGAKVWYFPDGYLPEKVGGGRLEAHEALMLLNTGDVPANVRLDFYFEDKAPAKDIPVARVKRAHRAPATAGLRARRANQVLPVGN